MGLFCNYDLVEYRLNYEFNSLFSLSDDSGGYSSSGGSGSPLPRHSPAMDADDAHSSGVDAVGSPLVSSMHCTMGVTFETHKTWTPTVDAALLPEVGQRFTTLAHGIKFYMEYALVSGFDVRHSTIRTYFS
nr:protein FAR1-RELATED SEQUENCE 5-like [Ipomoea batatas]